MAKGRDSRRDPRVQLRGRSRRKRNGRAIGGAAKVEQLSGLLTELAGSGITAVKKILGFGRTSEEAMVAAGRPTDNDGPKFRQALKTAAPTVVDAAEGKSLKSVGDF